MDLNCTKMRMDAVGQLVEGSCSYEEKQNLLDSAPHAEEIDTKPRTNFTLSKLAICLAVVATGLLCLVFLDGEKVVKIVGWLSVHKRESAVIFVGLGAVATVILFPGSVLCMSAGAAYGISLGSCLVWLAIVIGQTIAFGLGRYIFRDLVVHHAHRKISNFQAIDSAVAKSGWKLVALLRLSPLVPYNVLNYALSVTGIGLAEFTIASSLSVVPWIVFLTYLGSATRTAVMDSSMEGFDLKEIGWGPWCLSLLVTVFSLLCVSMLTKRAIHQSLLQASKNRDVETQRIKVCETGIPL